MPTRERRVRGRGPAPLCEYGCPVGDGLGHILQGCPDLHRLRTKRHDAVVDGLAAALRSSPGISRVRQEVSVPTQRGVLRPDLMYSGPRGTTIIDVQIVSDSAITSLDTAHGRKVAKYDFPNLRDVVGAMRGERVESITSLTLSWRGLVHREGPAQLVRDGLPGNKIKVLNIRALERSAHMWRWRCRRGQRGRAEDRRVAWHPDRP